MMGPLPGFQTPGQLPDSTHTFCQPFLWRDTCMYCPGDNKAISPEEGAMSSLQTGLP